VPKGTPALTKQMRNNTRKGAMLELQLIVDSIDYILDTETTGLEIVVQDPLKKDPAEPIQIAVLDANTGEPVYNEYIIPRTEINIGATRVHGKTRDSLIEQGAKPLEEVWEEFIALIKGKVVIAYNQPFDAAILHNTAVRFGLEEPDCFWLDAMWLFSRTRALWNPKFKSFAWMKLQEFVDPVKEDLNLHDALDDCVVVYDYLMKFKA
jgi:DNA polymerase III epsilon subunit-like protein